MPNTITAFYTFTANTPARSAEVNTNFDNYRGTIVPINTDTASASDNSHDLGSSEHRWRDAYIGRALVFDGSGTAQIDIKNNGSTLGSLKSSGLTRNTFATPNMTITSNSGLVALANGSMTTMFTQTFTCFRSPICFCLIPGTNFTDAGSYIWAQSTTHARINLLRDGTTIGSFGFGSGPGGQTYFPPVLNAVDVVAPGSYVYVLEARNFTSSSNSFYVSSVKLAIYEM